MKNKIIITFFWGFILFGCNNQKDNQTNLQAVNPTENALRQFLPEEHIKNVLKGELVELYDNKGHKLEGIRGRIGVSAPSKTGVEIGIDYMEMDAGSAFPLHTHEGDHILYVVDGSGIAHVDNKDFPLKKGDVIFVPSEYPHAFRTYPDAKDKFRFVAVGHPHKKLNSKDRMKLVEEEKKHNHTHSLSDSLKH
jgi:quercetin dioxygenase-like cupin family protein